MPVDHEERRKQIAEALLRIADTEGLQSASMRAVAAEAGVSLRLVQYYFTTKQALLLDALARLGTQLQARMDRFVRAAGDPPTPRSTVTAILTSILPTDAESRRITRTYAAYYTLVLGDPALEKQATAQPDLLEGFLARQIGAAQESGEVAPERDPVMTAAGLLAMVNGLGSGVLGGQRTGTRRSPSSPTTWTSCSGSLDDAVQEGARGDQVVDGAGDPLALPAEFGDQGGADRHQSLPLLADAREDAGDRRRGEPGGEQRADPPHRLDVPLGVHPVAARQAVRGEQPLLLVVAQQPFADAGPPHHLADAHRAPPRG